MTTVYFVRHGEAEGNIIRNFHGHFNSSLTENGLLQVERVTEKLKYIKFDAVYSSDLDRAYQTALPSAKLRGLGVTKLYGLREIYGGEWEDVPWDDLPVKYPESYDLWLNKPHLLKIPGGESMEGFQKRIIDTVTLIVNDNPDKTVLVALHGTGIKVLLCALKGFPLCKLNKVAWSDNTAVTAVEFDGDKIKIIAENDAEHLGELSTLKKQNWWKE